MKYNSLSIAAILALTGFLVNGCYKQNKPVAASLFPTRAVATVEGAINERDHAAGDRAPQAAKPEDIPTRWTDIKDYTFEKRDRFFEGLAQLETKVDAQIVELTAKRASMAITADTKEWDFTMKEMSAARAYLNETGKELRKANREIWDQEKDRVGQAWVRTQEAYSKVKASTTS